MCQLVASVAVSAGLGARPSSKYLGARERCYEGATQREGGNAEESAWLSIVFVLYTLV